MSADQRPDRVRLAVVSNGRPNWAAAEVAIAAPVAAPLSEHPSIGELFAVLISAPAAPSSAWVRRGNLDRERQRIELEVDSHPALLAWSEFLGLNNRSAALERTPHRLDLLRSGRVIVAGVRLRVAIRWQLHLVEVGS